MKHTLLYAFLLGVYESRRCYTTSFGIDQRSAYEAGRRFANRFSFGL